MNYRSECWRNATGFAALLCVLGTMVAVASSSELVASDRVEANVRVASATKPIDLVVYPDRVHLSSARDRQGIVVLAMFEDGSTSDVTESISLEFDRKDIVSYENETVLPKKDGRCVATIRYADRAVQLNLEVCDADQKRAIGFRQDILPRLTRAGCNAGKCHGSASGKDGFRLSLYGFDPQGDHYRLTRELVGRRIDLAAPVNSLLINKALGKVPHTGGALIEEDSEDLALLLEWLSQGATEDPVEAAVPISIEVYPKEAVFASPKGVQKLLVKVRYSDGTDRDVTPQAVFLSNNESCVSVSEEGLIEATGAGSAFVLARFDQFTEGTSIIVRSGSEFQFPELEPNNYIDELVYHRLRNLNILPSEMIEDEAFVRRVYIDLIGQLPTPSERNQFLEQRESDKRSRLVNALVQRSEFQDIWVMHWAELLQIRSNNGLSAKGLSLYDQWLRDRVHEGKTIDEIVRRILPSSGGTFDNPPTNYFQTETSPQLIAESVAQVFLGTRIQCAQCHNHPFDRWTMDDYYGFASFFSQVGYKQASDPRELTIYNLGEGELKHPIASRRVVPRFLDGKTPELDSVTDYREHLAQWIASENNFSFAKNISNIVWAHFLGTGIVDPIDDVRVSNPPSNPALLNALAERLIEYQYDVKRLASDICSSRTYQLSVVTNASNALDHRHFSHAKPRRLRAEILLDCLSQVTESKEKLPGTGAGDKAVHIADGQTPNYFLTTFGRSTRQSPCSCEVKTNPTLSQSMHLLNGETTNGKIKQGKLIARFFENKIPKEKMVSELYQRCYGRLPSRDELVSIDQQLERYDSPVEGLEDLFWALLNSNEFIFNH